jgi:hypothetical protein
MQILRFGLPLLMLVHGVSHLPGFVTSWRLRSLPDFPYHTVVLRGRVDIHDSGMRILGALWLTAALAFCLSAVSRLRARRAVAAAGVRGIGALDRAVHPRMADRSGWTVDQRRTARGPSARHALLMVVSRFRGTEA